MSRKLSLALLASLFVPASPSLAAELQPEIQAGLIMGPMLNGFAGGEISAGIKGQTWNATIQGLSP